MAGPKMEGVGREWRNLHDEEFLGLYSAQILLGLSNQSG